MPIWRGLVRLGRCHSGALFGVGLSKPVGARAWGGRRSQPVHSTGRYGPDMEQMPEDWERAIAVVAHPDDLEYGVASAVARWTMQGKSVAYVLATSGETGIDSLSPQECGPLREAEERRGAAAVGVSQVEFLGLPDGLIAEGVDLRRAIAGAVRRLRPQVILTISFDLSWGPGGPLNHADHRAVGLATVDAVRDAANRWLFPEHGGPWAGVKAVYVGAASDPTHYVDVSDTLDAGIESLRAHRAYIDGLGGGFDLDAFLRSHGAAAGAEVGCRYATTFRAIVT
jgi:LmbE family N-acetylglucosaminyl deacetylase